MKAMVMTFIGPRSPELIEAADRSRDRLGPAVLADPRMREEFVNLCILRQPGGHEQIVLTVRSEAGLALVRDLVTTSELSPGEDGSLLPGPDSVEIFDVVEASGTVEPIGAEAR